MKKALCFLLLASASTATFAQDMYLEYKMSGPITATSKMYTSFSGVRVESSVNIPQLGNRQTVMLLPAGKAGKVIVLNDQTKTYTESAPGAAGIKDMKYSVKVVGHERVGTYNCTHALVTVGSSTMDMWTSKDIPGYETLFKTAMASNGGMAEGMYRELVSKGADGMMVKYTNAGGGNGMGLTMELVKAERHSNPASMFSIPAGYTKSSFDPAAMKNMTPAQRQKAVQEMMKQNGIKP